MRTALFVFLFSTVLLFDCTRDNGAQINIPGGPMTIAACHEGRFGDRCPWYLSINSGGQAELTVSCSRETQKRFLVPSEKMQSIRKLVIESGFFELDEEYGESYMHNTNFNVSVTIGMNSKSIRVTNFVGWAQHENPKRRTGILSLYMNLRGLIDDCTAVDARDSIRPLLPKG